MDGGIQILKVLKPRGSRVLVEPAAKDTKLASGIVIPEMAAEQKNFGTIIAVGQAESDLKVGDPVLYTSYAGVVVKLPVGYTKADGTTDTKKLDYLLLDEADVIATFPDGFEGV